MQRIASFIDGAFVLALAGLVGALSAFFFAQAADSADRMALARRIDRQETINPSRLANQVVAVLRLVDKGPICGVIDRQANILIAFRDLSQRNQAEDYEGWFNAAANVDRLLRHSLRCSPHDGELWARLALVGRAIVIAPQSIDAMLTMSEALAPADLQAVRMRSQLWGIGAGSSGQASRDAALSDLRTLLEGVQNADAARMLAPFRPAMQADIDRLAADLPADRQTMLNRHSALRPAETPTVENAKKLLFLDAE